MKSVQDLLKEEADANDEEEKKREDEDQDMFLKNMTKKRDSTADVQDNILLRRVTMILKKDK